MYVWVVLQICVVTNALHTLCISMYHYDCLYICKDLTEGEINQSINQSNPEDYQLITTSYKNPKTQEELNYFKIL